MKYITLTIGLFIINFAFGQHLYPEKYDECKLSRFCLDCGDTKAELPQDFVSDFISNLNEKSLRKIKGSITVQILVDSIGKPCLLSAKNESNVKSKKLGLQNGISNTKNWLPAITRRKAEQASVSLLLIFKDGQLAIRRKEFDFKNQSNMKSVGTPDVKGSKESKLSESWTVFNQRNSKLPWDMSRAVFTDNDGIVWIGTDNGLVKMTDGNMEIFDTHNSGLKSEMYNKNETVSIRDATVDKQNNKWLIANWDVYKYDGQNWTVFDSINSPINWARKLFVDKTNNVYFTSWRGVSKYDGDKWTTIDTSNSKLPSNKTLGVFVDSKERVWIGTFSGNIRIDADKTVEYNNSDSPLKEGFISKMYEDKSGNLWFDLYNDDDKSKAGMFILRTNGDWESLKPKNSELFTKNSINDFLLDEDKNILWIALNSVGLIKYDINNDKWETYTNENSNIPSIHVMQLTKDKNGTIWGATFAGLIKLNQK
jgi:hypothetical protein